MHILRVTSSIMVKQMDNLEKMVLQALKDKAPAMHKELQVSGEIKAFVKEIAEQIADSVITRTQEIARKQGRDKAKTLEEKAGILKMSEALANEQVLAELLEFPQGETSPSSQGETTNSDQTT